MRQLSIADLLDLARVPDAENRIVKVFDWYFERHKLVVQGVLAYLTALSVALLTAFIRGDLSWQLILVLALVNLCGIGFLCGRSYLRLRSLHREFLVALRTFDAFKNYDA